MVVIASRQTSTRPETIRTRLARFMPSPAAAAWTTAWSSQTEHAADIATQSELCAAEHLGCYGAAVTHALAQAEIAPIGLRVTAEAPAAGDEATQPIVLEVRAHIPGVGLDQSIFEAIVRRADPACGAWRKLTSEHKIQVVAVLEDADAADEPYAETASISRRPAMLKPAPKSQPIFAANWTSMLKLARPALPSWLKPRTAIMYAVALGVIVVTQHNLLFPG